jgi:hypothetical protein
LGEFGAAVEGNRMTESGRRRRWRQWIVVAVIIFAMIAGAGWIRQRRREQQVISQSRNVELGQTESEVLAGMKGQRGVTIIGSRSNRTPTSGHNMQKSKILFFGPASTQLDQLFVRISRKLGHEPVIRTQSMPVEVRLDDEGKVYWIRRGTEISDGGTSRSDGESPPADQRSGSS